MMISVRVSALFAGTLLFLTSTAGATPPAGSTFLTARAPQVYCNTSVTFEANQGQSDPKVRFLSHQSGSSVFLTSREAILVLHRSPQRSLVLRLQLVGGNPTPEVLGLDPLPGDSNYFVGSDPARWRTHIATYAQVRYKDVYKGIDLIYYGRQAQLEYDFVLAPGADPAAIQLRFADIRKMRLRPNGDLVLSMSGGRVEHRKPVIYQEIAGVRHEIAGGYVLRNGHVGFRVARYDTRQPLIIDPVLVYSTYLGGSGNEGGAGIAVDAAGSIYVTGITDSYDFPTLHALQPVKHDKYYGYPTVFVTKLSPTGTLLYSTYLGGSDDDYVYGIAADAAGNAYVTGSTGSDDFPTLNALQPVLPGRDNPPGTKLYAAFVTKLSPTGTLAYSTYLGGTGWNDTGSGIAADPAGNTYITGFTQSDDFPTLHALQPVLRGYADTFVTKLSPTGTLLYSTYLGGSDGEVAEGIAADATGNAYVTGGTISNDFPTLNALQPVLNGGEDAFVTKLSPSGTLLYSTYLGGSHPALRLDLEWGTGIATDAAGNAYVAGQTVSDDFPTLHALQPVRTGGHAAFVTKLSPTGTLLFSTYLGGSGSESYQAIKVAADAAGNAYISAATESDDFPLLNALQPVLRGRYNAFVTKLSPSGTLLFSTYLGGSDSEGVSGIAVDAAESVYVTGFTSSDDFPTLNALQPVKHSVGFGGDAFITVISTGPVPPGDLNGDGQVDCADVSIVRASLGKKAGETGFDPRADVNHDDIVDVKDLALVAQRLSTGTQCP